MSELLGELYAVERLQILAGDSDGAQLRREYLVRRAAVLDRLAEEPAQPDWVMDYVIHAGVAARELREHDLTHSSTRGAIPADAACWTDSPRGYVRQEHRAWIIDNDL
ncbi:hypothetical protein L0F81_00370 [Streptomyces tricolor]|uniref:Uncharacterized protein n=1 Tax=Streptomyces tricolor TaxID=68277 RepID=A0ABS9J859_9ACTN|nr:hypothetical protein [Streptomyces tricolor]MCG0061754.1 hypothetical protein [Streptomyces tricolor]